MYRFAVLTAAALGVTACDRPSVADRQALVGRWQPEDGSKRTIEFKQDGEFDYVNLATWRLRWELGGRGRVHLTGPDKTIVERCHYRIESNRLLIDNGSGASCASPGVTPPVPMPMVFRRAP
jgi:hypothetical protein